MPGGLTCAGVCWTILSTIATILIIAGFLTPEWLIGSISANGQTVKAYFGSYKRCNYPVYDKETNKVVLLNECGRYESFAAVPSQYWQSSILAGAAGSSLSLLLILLLIPSMCMQDVVTHSSALIVGFFQFLACVLLVAALMLWPMGWDNPETRDACGEESGQFLLGRCEIGRAYMAMIFGTILLIFSSLFSVCGGRRIEKVMLPHHHRHRGQGDSYIQGFENPRLDFAK
ncbi:hypothetical protein WR25_09741 [Diploscapter pachys]|uniref:LHFPL tetraspan subfamily member 6 protein n=1 Tax=Diploscapter pachys TaxID=2018661 RepID=A0A2A2K374_9BILA|nr:hypothetical protein WR25_09741 [Diploscapter pachys]